MRRLPSAQATERPSERRHLLLIPLAALVAVLPLIMHGCSCGHDFDFHLLNWMEAASQFSHGNLHPHWAFSAAFNAGEPRFVFYPPLSWVLGALLGLLLTHLPGVTPAAGWNATPILFTWIALTASGFTLYRLARAFATTNAALLAATLYLANPYMLFTAYERTAYAELLAAAWIPLLFHAILRDRVTIPGIALPVALLWLTNAPAAVMGSYVLALLATLRLISTYRAAAVPGAPGLASETWVSRHKVPLQLALNTTAGTVLGLAIAAFYIVPAAYERRFVQISMATIAGMRIDQNFLFKHTGTSPDALLHDQVLHTASLIAVTLLAATAIALAATLLRRKPPTKEDRHPDRSNSQLHRELRSGVLPASVFPTLPLAILAAAIAFLLTPLSARIWNHAPEAAFLQFPWRLLAILTPILAMALARVVFTRSDAPSIAVSSRWVGRTKFAAPVVSIFLAAVFTLPANRLFLQPCDSEDTAPARLALFNSNTGTDPTDEYTPASADNDALKPNAPPYWLADSPNAPVLAAAQTRPAPLHLTLTAPRAEDLILNLRDYPAWRISRNGAPYPAREQRDDGLIAIPMPAGPSTINIRYAQMLDQTVGDATTVLALLILLSLSIKRHETSPL